MTADSGGIKSEPLPTLEEAKEWADNQLVRIKQRIEAYRKTMAANPG